MSTTSNSVISELQAALINSLNWEADSDSIKNPSNCRLELLYDGDNYDITVTRLCPNSREEMDFGSAIRCMKKGLKVARKGWNGKGMYLWLLPATEVKKEWCRDPRLIEAMGERDALRCLGSIRMFTATKEVLTGWLASQTDMLAEDWVLVD